MLVVTRKEGQSVYIGETIEVKVIGIVNGRVKIGIGAPDELRVIRDDAINTQPRDLKTNIPTHQTTS